MLCHDVTPECIQSDVRIASLAIDIWVLVSVIPLCVSWMLCQSVVQGVKATLSLSPKVL